MNQSSNKRKNNNIKFDKRPENFQINMNNINITRRAKTGRNKKCRTRKSRSKIRSKNQRRETIRITKGRTKRRTKRRN